MDSMKICQNNTGMAVEKTCLDIVKIISQPNALTAILKPDSQHTPGWVNRDTFKLQKTTTDKPQAPWRGSVFSAGIDLFPMLGNGKTTTLIDPGKTVRVDTGFVVQDMPDGAFMFRDRSSVAAKQTLRVDGGVCQKGCMLSVDITNYGDNPVEINNSAAIAQLIFFNDITGLPAETDVLKPFREAEGGLEQDEDEVSSVSYPVRFQQEEIPTILDNPGQPTAVATSYIVAVDKETLITEAQVHRGPLRLKTGYSFASINDSLFLDISSTSLKTAPNQPATLKAGIIDWDFAGHIQLVVQPHENLTAGKTDECYEFLDSVTGKVWIIVGRAIPRVYRECDIDITNDTGNNTPAVPPPKRKMGEGFGSTDEAAQKRVKLMLETKEEEKKEEDKKDAEGDKEDTTTAEDEEETTTAKEEEEQGPGTPDTLILDPPMPASLAASPTQEPMALSPVSSPAPSLTPSPALPVSSPIAASSPIFTTGGEEEPQKENIFQKLIDAAENMLASPQGKETQNKTQEPTTEAEPEADKAEEKSEEEAETEPADPESEVGKKETGLFDDDENKENIQPTNM